MAMNDAMLQKLGSLGVVDPEAMQALREAIVRRQQGDQMPALDTQSGVSPTAAPLPPEASGAPAPGPAGPEAMAGPEIAPAQGNPESRLIISALKDRLKAISTIEGGVPPKAPSGGV